MDLVLIFALLTLIVQLTHTNKIWKKNSAQQLVFKTRAPIHKFSLLSDLIVVTRNSYNYFGLFSAPGFESHDLNFLLLLLFVEKFRERKIKKKKKKT